MKTVYILGLVIAIIPFLGIPYAWKTFLFVLLGLIIFIKAYSFSKKEEETKEKENHGKITFKQNDGENFKTDFSSDEVLEKNQGEKKVENNIKQGE